MKANTVIWSLFETVFMWLSGEISSYPGSGPKEGNFTVIPSAGSDSGQDMVEKGAKTCVMAN